MTIRRTLIIAMLSALALALAVQPLLAQEEDEEDQQDQQDLMQADGEEEEPDDGSFQGPYRHQAALQGLSPEFHPNYKLTHTRDQDVSSWTHAFNMSYPFTSRISFRASSNIVLRENEVLHRINTQETWNAGLDLAVSSALSTGIKFTRTNQEDVRNKGKTNEVRSFRERESVSLSTDYRKTYLSNVGVTLGATGGFETNKYGDVRSKGSSQKINASLRYAAPLGIGTEFRYSGSHSLLDSEQGALKSSDESVEHNLSGHVDYKWMNNSFAVDMRRGASNKEYPKEEQTENRLGDTEAVDLSANLDLLENLTTSVGLSYSRYETRYKVEPSKNNDLRTRSTNASIGYTLGATRFTTELRSEKKRNDYFDTQTGDSYSNSIGASLSHDFGQKLSAVLRGRTSLISHHYDDVEANDQDRDLFDQEGTLQVDYSPRNDIKTSLFIKLREDDLIYIRRSRTGDNKTSQTYSVQPSITKSFGPRVSVTQKYELSADYTFYTYDPDSNFLIRNFTVSSSVDWRPMGKVRLSMSHRYRSQDEGSYVEDEFGLERYGKNSERDDNNLDLRIGYKLFGLIDLDVSQGLSFQKKWNIRDGERELDYEKFDTTLTGKAQVDYQLESGTKLSLKIGRTYRDATNITERQREVWDISLNIDKTF